MIQIKRLDHLNLLGHINGSICMNGRAGEKRWPYIKDITSSLIAWDCELLFSTITMLWLRHFSTSVGKRGLYNRFRYLYFQTYIYLTHVWYTLHTTSMTLMFTCIPNSSTYLTGEFVIVSFCINTKYLPDTCYLKCLNIKKYTLCKSHS